MLGSAIALTLLFKIPLLWAVLITGLDVLLLLGFKRVGMRSLEAIVLVLVATIGVCYFIEVIVVAADPAKACLSWARGSFRRRCGRRA